VGDDANPCSRTAPCKTFAGAISKTAAGGEIDALDPGGFGGVTITKSMTIDGTPHIAGVLVAGTAGIVVNAGTSDTVIIRGLDINGLSVGSPGTRGIQVIQAGKVIIQDCEIYGFSPRNISVEPSAAPVQVYISHTRIKASASNGIVIQPASPSIRTQVSMNNVEIAENTNFGISMTAGASVIVKDSSIVDNGFSTALANIRADGTGGTATLQLDNVVVSGSATGLLSVGGATIRVSNSTITDNVTGVLPSGGSILSFGNNRLVGNTSNGTFSGTVSFQ